MKTLIKTENIRPYSKIFDKIKVLKHSYFESVYLDFKNNKILFRNSNTVVSIQAVFENHENEDNFYVIGDKFFTLAFSYDQLTFENDQFVSPDGNKFKLKSFKEDFDFPEEEDYEKLDINDYSYFQNHLRKSLSFVDSSNSSLAGIFIESNRLWALQPIKCYSSLIDVNKSLSLDFQISRIISLLDISTNIELFTKQDEFSNKIMIKTDDCVIIHSNSSLLEIPVDTESVEFLSSIPNDNFIKIEKENFISALQFLQPFTKDVNFSKVVIDFLTDSSEISFLIKDESNIIEYKTPVESFSNSSYFEKQNVTLSLLELHRSIANIEDEKIDIFIDFKKTIVKLTPNNQDNYYILQSTIKD